MATLSCTNTSCALHGQPVVMAFAEALGMKCPTCQGPLGASGSGLSETAERVIASYPYPIALPLSQLAGKTDVEARAKVVTRVLVQALKYQALILQSEYLLSNRVDEELNRILQKDLLRPLDSVWIKLVETAIAGMASDSAPAFAPELIEAYGEAETHRKRADQVEVPGKGYHDDSGEFVPTTARLGLVRALLHYRNDETHEDQTDADARERLEFFLGVLDRLLDTFSWMSRYTLLKREDGQVWRMMGAAPESIDHPWPDHLNETGLALVAPDGKRALPLFPLFVVPRQFVAEVEDDEDLLIYASNTGKRVCYSSPRGHRRELKSAMRPWRQLLEAKALALPELTPETLTPKELGRRGAIVTRDTEEALLASRKLLKGVYVHRPDAEVHLRPLPGTAFPPFPGAAVDAATAMLSSASWRAQRGCAHPSVSKDKPLPFGDCPVLRQGRRPRSVSGVRLRHDLGPLGSLRAGALRVPLKGGGSLSLLAQLSVCA